MESLTCNNPRLTSLPGEAPARLSISDPVGSALDRMRVDLSPEMGIVLDCLVHAFDVPGSGLGLGVLLREIKLGLANLSKSWSVPDWVNRINELSRVLDAHGFLDVGRDAAVLRSQAATPLKDFLAVVSSGVQPNEVRGVRCARAFLSLYLLASGQVLSRTLAAEMKRWSDGSAPRSLDLGQLSTSTLREAHSSMKVDSPGARFVATVLRAIEEPLRDPFSCPKVNVLVCHQDPTGSDVCADESQADIVQSDQVEACRDPLAWKLARQGNAGMRARAGVANLWDTFDTFELEAYVPVLAAGLRGSSAEEALAALLTLLLGVQPSQFGRVPIREGGGAGIWLDVSTGLVNWNLDEVIAKPAADKLFERGADDRHHQIPLPILVANELRKKLVSHPNARALDQLFDSTMPMLKQGTRAYLRQVALTSHRPTLTRISTSWGRYVLSICGDESTASAISMDFTIGTTANFNYLRLRRRRMAQILRDCCSRLGLGSPVDALDRADEGALRLPQTEDAGRFVVDHLAIISEELRALPKRASFERVRAAHNRVASSFHAVFRFVLGLRGTEEETVTASKVDAKDGLIALAEKYTSAYHHWRVLQMTPTLLKWLVAYRGWLMSLAYRLQALDRELARKIRLTAEGTSIVDSMPLFFVLDDNLTVVPCGSQTVAACFAPYGFEGNAGRHFIEDLLRGAGLDTAVIMGWQGRGEPGQEVAGEFSCVVPMKMLRQANFAIEAWLTSLGLPEPIQLEGRTMELPVRASYALYVPRLAAVARPEVMRRTAFSAAACPFGPDTPRLAAAFKEILHGWRNYAVPAGVVGVALSLVIEDGLWLRDELIGVLKSINDGTIYEDRDRRIFFVDARIDKLGLRRVYLSEVTRRLVEEAMIDAESCDVAKIVDTLDYQDCVKACGVELHEHDGLLSAARAYYKLRLPATVAAWCDGRIFARTTRPETIARHLSGYCEVPGMRQKFRRRTRVSDVCSSLLADAQRAVRNKGSHRRALDELSLASSSSISSFEPGTAAWLNLGYCQYLASVLGNVASVERYVSACRPFFGDVERSIESLGWAMVDFERLVKKHTEAARPESVDVAKLAAIQHALDWLRVDVRIVRPAGPPPSAFIYADFPSLTEMDRAVAFLKSSSIRTGDDHELASIVLMLCREGALRSDEVLCLRVVDVCLKRGAEHIAISPDANSSLKSDNAPRVIRLHSSELIIALESLVDRRRARFLDDELVPIFGDDASSRSTARTERIHHLVSEALWRATGSDHVRPHATRTRVITDAIAGAVDVALSDSSQFLAHRQALFGISVAAGHGWPGTTVGDYGCGYDLLRRRAVDSVHAAEGSEWSSAFCASVTGVRECTYRKRASRRNGIREVDFLEGAGGSLRSFGGELQPLSNLVKEGLTLIQQDETTVVDDEGGASVIYVGLRILREAEGDARKVALLSERKAAEIESQFDALSLNRAGQLVAVKHIDRNDFVKAVVTSGVVAGMEAMAPSGLHLSKVVDSIRVAGSPFEFNVVEDVVGLRDWVPIWAAAGFCVQVMIRRTDRSALDAHRKVRLEDSGFQVRFAADRSFSRGIQAVVRLLLIREDQGKARHSRQAGFLFTACAIAIYFQKQEVENV